VSDLGGVKIEGLIRLSRAARPCEAGGAHVLRPCDRLQTDVQVDGLVLLLSVPASNVVAVLIYASGEHVVREALITCDDPKVARLLRSYADASRSVAFAAGTIRLSISQNYPAPPKTVTVSVPIVRDDLDLARSQVPAGLHVHAWRR
jgi:hypothetical protein